MGYFPLVTRPTRYGNSINSLIDNIYCNITYKPVSNGIIFSDISVIIYQFLYYMTFQIKVIQNIIHINISEN